MFAVDMPSLFSDFAVDANWGSNSAKVILDIPDEVMLGNNVLAADNQLIFPADKFVGIDEGDVVEIVGSSDKWLLRETPRASSDGAVKTVSVQPYSEPV